MVYTITMVTGYDRFVQGLREMVEILESSKNTLEMEVTSVNELKEKVNKWQMITS